MSSPDPDPLWERIREETARHASEEPMLASFLHATILNHTALEDALSFHLANQLDSATASSLLLREVTYAAMSTLTLAALLQRNHRPGFWQRWLDSAASHPQRGK